MWLSAKHRITVLLIRDYHRLYFHAEVKFLDNILRLRFWFVGNLIREIQKCVKSCARCIRFSKQSPSVPIMASLPFDHVNVDFPFAKIGIDFAGPIDTRPIIRSRAQTHMKAYIAVFVCFVSKAVHLEAVSELSSAAFLAAFKRFAARRGLPKIVYSDNGSNFVGANAELRHHLKELQKDSAVQNFAANYNIIWKFNSPSAPHMGGLWEAAIGSAKFHLKRTIGIQRLTFEELTTILAHIEAILNSRPIVPRRVLINDIDALTPGHFILLQLKQCKISMRAGELGLSTQESDNTRKFSEIQCMEKFAAKVHNIKHDVTYTKLDSNDGGGGGRTSSDSDDRVTQRRRGGGHGTQCPEAGGRIDGRGRGGRTEGAHPNNDRNNASIFKRRKDGSLKWQRRYKLSHNKTRNRVPFDISKKGSFSSQVSIDVNDIELTTSSDEDETDISDRNVYTETRTDLESKGDMEATWMGPNESGDVYREVLGNASQDDDEVHIGIEEATGQVNNTQKQNGSWTLSTHRFHDLVEQGLKRNGLHDVYQGVPDWSLGQPDRIHESDPGYRTPPHKNDTNRRQVILVCVHHNHRPHTHAFHFCQYSNNQCRCIQPRHWLLQHGITRRLSRDVRRGVDREQYEHTLRYFHQDKRQIVYAEIPGVCWSVYTPTQRIQFDRPHWQGQKLMVEVCDSTSKLKTDKITKTTNLNKLIIANQQLLN